MAALSTADQPLYGSDLSVGELCSFACWLGEARKSPTARDDLLAIAATAVDALEELGTIGRKLAGDVVAAQKKDYSRFTGQNAAKDVANSSQPAPEGSVRAGPFAQFEASTKLPPRK